MRRQLHGGHRSQCQQLNNLTARHESVGQQRKDLSMKLNKTQLMAKVAELEAELSRVKPVKTVGPWVKHVDQRDVAAAEQRRERPWFKR